MQCIYVWTARSFIQGAMDSSASWNITCTTTVGDAGSPEDCLVHLDGRRTLYVPVLGSNYLPGWGGNYQSIQLHKRDKVVYDSKDWRKIQLKNSIGTSAQLAVDQGSRVQRHRAAGGPSSAPPGWGLGPSAKQPILSSVADRDLLSPWSIIVHPSSQASWIRTRDGGQ